MVSRHDIILGTGFVDTSLDWVPSRISEFVGQLAVLHDDETALIPPQPIVREDGKTLFACSGVQIIYPQIFDGDEIPPTSQLISQPVIRTQHLDNAKEGTSTSFVNYNLIRFGMSQTEHNRKTAEFFECMKATDSRATGNYQVVTLHDAPQVWNGLPITMTTNDKLWINGIELGESIFYSDMPLPSGDTVSVSELAFGLERLFFATGDPQESYYSSQLGGLDTTPSLKDKAAATVADTLKSSTLMAIAGVTPSNKSHGSKMRKFLKKAAVFQSSARLDSQAVVNNAYRYWNNFLIPELDPDTIYSVVTSELGRNRNRLVLNKLFENYGIEVDMNINQRPDVFDDQLRRTGRLTLTVAGELFDQV